MRILVFSITAICLCSCASLPFSQWNSDLIQIENQLVSQKKEANKIATPDVFLFNGVYNATKKKNADPYPLIKKMANGIENENQILSAKTDSCLNKIAQLKSVIGENTLSKKHENWNSFKLLIADASALAEQNKHSLSIIHKADHEFDSICQANKIKGTPLLEYEAQLAEIISKLEDDFTILKNTFQKFKREITNRADRKGSMRSIGEMKQKIRKIESEQLQLSNLYSRLNSLRSDAMLFEGPYIEKMAEVQLIENKAQFIEELLSQLRSLEESYAQSE